MRVTDIEAAFEELRAEVERLTAGADPTPVSEGVEMTPGQLLHKLNTATADERMRMVERIQQWSGEASRCFVMNHEAHIEDLQDRLRRDHELARWLIAEARWVAAWGGTAGVNEQSGIGDATVIKHDDGRRTVKSAAPIIRVAAEVLADPSLEEDVIEPDGTLRLDTAGEYRYRFLRHESPRTLLYERVTDG